MKLIFKSIEIHISLKLLSVVFCGFITFNLQSHMNIPSKCFRRYLKQVKHDAYTENSTYPMHD